MTAQATCHNVQHAELEQILQEQVVSKDMLVGPPVWRGVIEVVEWCGGLASAICACEANTIESSKAVTKIKHARRSSCP